MTKNAKLAALITSGTLLAGATGYMTATALSQGTQEPTSTTTVQIGTGETGPPGATGPPGPPGPAGEVDCGTGWHLGVVVFPQQGVGPTTIKTCVKD